MPAVKDQINHLIELESYPQRIISLVPSITEYLFDLSLGEKIVGITKFCVHPKEKIKGKEIIGGTKQQNLNKIKELKPDLIIASKEENVKKYVEKLSKICPIYVSDVNDFDSATNMMKDIGELTGRFGNAKELTSNIIQQFDSIKKPAKDIKIAYCIWKKPWMWAGNDTFISKMLGYSGFKNIIQKDRYPEIEMSEIVKVNPDYIFLSSEPFPFQTQHIDELRIEFPESKFVIVDGEMFSWYGSRMLKAPQYFNSLLDQLESE
ncbi:ABC transporter substrate-binding protein [Marivirga sp.]|uniref:ABC transporter substrate-binding protein n=1 Tax=Marivirga sp. TaxID=2018662 RepID=UPI0025E8301B|nr:helical backbone metal receptor [Marivirga sp.]